ncbi:hypothetical protein LguiB_007878 [Lonicera macranthoides]
MKLLFSHPSNLIFITEQIQSLQVVFDEAIQDFSLYLYLSLINYNFLHLS